MTTKARFFADAVEFRDWLREHHEKQIELWVGFHKKHKGQVGLTYSEAVEEALCFGWIDGVLNRIDADRYMHRFSPRQPRSTWSRRNVVRAETLIAAGRMHPAGLAVFSARTEARTAIYSFERTTFPRLPAAFARQFRSHRAAWTFFQSQPAGYRRIAIHLVLRPKREVTRRRWLERLIAASAAGRRLGA